MRQVILDTETTGLSPQAGHRITEIGCVELVDLMPTGRTYQQYINPERDVPAESFRITGLSTAFLQPYPVFPEITEAFLDFIADAPLVIHNAPFDLSFLNAELVRAGHQPLNHPIIDTLALARKKFPGAPASLDALSRRFKVDLSQRTYHGALLDAQILASVYLELMGGRQKTFFSSCKQTHDENTMETNEIIFLAQERPTRSFALTDKEKKQHAQYLKATIINSLWNSSQ